ncbi:MAG: hypothetical protein ACK5LN_08865 [Propioniciclava sp.]
MKSGWRGTSTVVAGVVITAALSACAGDPVPIRTERYIPRAQRSPQATSAGPSGPQLTTYVNEDVGFACRIPEGWQLKEAEQGDRATATHPEKLGSVTCFGGFTSSLGDDDAQDPQGWATQVAAELEDDGYEILDSTDDEFTYRVLAQNDEDYAVRWGAIGSAGFRGVSWDMPEDQLEVLEQAVELSISQFNLGEIGELAGDEPTPGSNG